MNNQLFGMELLLQEMNTKYVTGNTKLKVNEQFVFATPPTSGSYTVTLPPVAAAIGRFYYIETPSNDTGTVTVSGLGDEAGSTYNASLTAAGDHVLLFSTGKQWRTLLDVTT